MNYGQHLKEMEDQTNEALQNYYMYQKLSPLHGNDPVTALDRCEQRP